MTATRSLFDNLVEGRSYQVSTGRDPSGRLRWNAFRYESVNPPLGPVCLTWNQIATRQTDRLDPGEYRTSALAWLAEVAGIDPADADVVLILPDGTERIEPASAP